MLGLKNLVEEIRRFFSPVSSLRVSFGGPDGLRWGRKVFRWIRRYEYGLVQMKPLGVLFRGYAKNRKPGAFRETLTFRADSDGWSHAQIGAGMQRIRTGQKRIFHMRCKRE